MLPLLNSEFAFSIGSWLLQRLQIQQQLHAQLFVADVLRDQPVPGDVQILKRPQRLERSVAVVAAEVSAEREGGVLRTGSAFAVSAQAYGEQNQQFKPMPGFGKRLTEEQIQQIVEYERGL